MNYNNFVPLKVIKFDIRNAGVVILFIT